ncbi:MAG: ATP-binding cassette domain-containing protein, partial [Burkholderiaceae bacterium]
MSLIVHADRLSTGQAILLRDLHLQVDPGDIHTVMGASGSGKSSLLAAICGTLPQGLQFVGSVSLDGQRIDALPTERRRVGILFQDDLLFAH